MSKHTARPLRQGHRNVPRPRREKSDEGNLRPPRYEDEMRKVAEVWSQEVMNILNPRAAERLEV